MARPSKLTPELQEQICALIEAGNYAEVACAAVGISSSTFYAWRQRGEQEQSGEYTDFAAAVDAAEATAERNAVAIVQMGMREDPRLCMTFLERRFPKRWQRHPNADKDAKPELPSVVNVRILERVDANGKDQSTFEYVYDEELEEIEQRAASERTAPVAPPGENGSSPPDAATVLPPAR